MQLTKSMVPMGGLGRLGIAFSISCLLVSSAFAANTWWVAKEDPNASDANVGSEEAPFRTIQAALDNPNFVAGDTVNVKRGIYDEGATVTDASYVSNRVTVTKAAHIIGVDGADVTFIMGAPSPGSTDSYGRGPYATRCVFVTADALSTTLEKLTLCGGRTTGLGSSDSSGKDVGGGFYAADNSKTPLLVDCVISNCVSWKGAGMRGGTAVRCYIADNYGTSSGVALNGAQAYCCIFAYNRGYQTFSSSTLCNCTIYSNTGGGAVTANSMWSYNCIFVDCLKPHNDCSIRSPGSVFTATNGVAGLTLVDRWQIVGPAAGDWRVVAGSAAETAGDGRYANNISGILNYRYKDFYGNPIPETGTIMAGAVQASAPVVAGGIAFNSSNVAGMAIDGHAVHPNDWILATAYPTQFVVTATAGTVYRYIRRLAGGWEPVAPRMDDSVLLMPPPTVGALSTNDVQYANKEFWVDPNTGDDSNPGTAAEPFKTLQESFRAIHRSNVSGDKFAVHAAAGDYQEDGEPVARYQNGSYTLTNRLCIGTGVAVRYKGAGAGRSVIWGAPDGSSSTGIGNAAIGCVAAYSTSAIVQGFTLTNGYTRNNTDSYGRGNIAYGRKDSPSPILADCVISGGRAKNSAIGYMQCVRCVFTGITTEGTLCESGSFDSCLFVGNTLTDTTRSCVCGSYCTFSTYVGSPNVIPYGADIWVVGNVIDTGYYIRTTTRPRASMVENIRTLGGVSGVAADVAAFVDPANGDFRVKSYSGALRCTPAIADGTDWGQFAWRHAVGDLSGRPLVTTPGGGFLAGAVQEVVPAANAVGIVAPYGGIGDGESTYASGERTISGPIAVTRAAGTRPCIGFTVDGVTNLFDEATLPAIVSPSAQGSGIAALYTTDWYVDGENGDDGKDGFTSGGAKKTLAAILAVDGLASGDTVHAAAGTYDEGVMTYTEEQPMRSRAIVPAGVTLLGDEGAERTIIVGAAATVDADANGLGTNAIRCVTLTDAAIRGFTLTGGHTACIGGHGTEQEQNAAKNNAENIGGGVGFATGSTDKHVVTDCIISNNVAWRGGGAYYASLRRCRIIGNKGCDGSGAASGTYRCEHYGCVVAHQRANYNVMYPSGVYDSTLVHTTSSQSALYVTSQTCPVYNTIVIGSAANDNTQNRNVAYNSFFTKVSAKTSEDYFGAGSALVDASELLLDADYRPVVGANVAIDGGSTNYYKTAQSGKTDILGGQRIYNGSLDAGALEADWRPAYAKLLGGQGLTVLTADPMVVTGEVASVCIPTGTVTMAWANIRAPRSVRQTYCVEVTGNGTLTVTIDGESTDYTSADGALKLTRKTTVANTDMSFAYQPGENDTGCAVLSGFERFSGTTLCFR